MGESVRGQRTGGGGPQLNSLRLSSSKNLTGQAGIRESDEKVNWAH